jgi:hypothetical protein
MGSTTSGGGIPVRREMTAPQQHGTDRGAVACAGIGRRIFPLRMIFSESRFPLFGIML